MVFITDDTEIEQKQKGRRCTPPGVPNIDVLVRRAVSGSVAKLNKLCLDLLQSVGLSHRYHLIPRLFSSN